MALILELAGQALQMAIVVAIAPLLIGISRKVKARLLRRIGPPVLQPYFDIWKLMHKEMVLAHNASWVYRIAPYVVFAVTWVAAALVPTYCTNLLFSWSADLIEQQQAEHQHPARQKMCDIESERAHQNPRDTNSRKTASAAAANALPRKIG